ncbi:hypothetical protein Hypma_004549, partial [Hypsizygus marmoreus]
YGHLEWVLFGPYPVAFSFALFSLCAVHRFVFTYWFSTDGLGWMTVIPENDVLVRPLPPFVSGDHAYTRQGWSAKLVSSLSYLVWFYHVRSSGSAQWNLSDHHFWKSQLALNYLPVLSFYMLRLCRSSSDILYSSLSTFKLRAFHLGKRRCQRRHNSSGSSKPIKYTTIIKPKGLRPLRVISTLDPSRLQDSDFVDLSPKLQNPRSQLPSIVSVIPITQQTSSSPSRLRSLLYYAISGVGSRFPQNSHGFLYYHRDPQLPATSGAVRFRLTPDAHASSFSVGTDLMLPDGRSPWAVWLVTIANAVMYVGLKQLLLSDSLVTPELLEHCRHLGARSEVPNGLNQMYHYMLFTLEQPFILDLASSHSFAVVGPQRIERAK